MCPFPSPFEMENIPLNKMHYLLQSFSNFIEQVIWVYDLMSVAVFEVYSVAFYKLFNNVVEKILINYFTQLISE